MKNWHNRFLILMLVIGVALFFIAGSLEGCRIVGVV